MRRETTNVIRTILEEFIPPAIRDSSLMRWLFRLHWGNLIDRIEVFRERIPFVTDEEYRSVYEELPRIQDDTDNSKGCMKLILSEIRGTKVLDVGCGTGHLAGWLKTRQPHLEITGLDFVLEPEIRTRHPDISFSEGNIEKLPFPDSSFDTVICTHVLEHILDFQRALCELRRVSADTVIIVVPREREYRFTFNPHIHFFPYTHSFLRYLIPIPSDHRIESVGRDIFYVERHISGDGNLAVEQVS